MRPVAPVLTGGAHVAPLVEGCGGRTLAPALARPAGGQRVGGGARGICGCFLHALGAGVQGALGRLCRAEEAEEW